MPNSDNLAERILAASSGDNADLVEHMAESFPWMRGLSKVDQEACAQDLVDAVRRARILEQPHLVTAELASWQETASAVSAGLGYSDPGWLDEPRLVARP